MLERAYQHPPPSCPPDDAAFCPWLQEWPSASLRWRYSEVWIYNENLDIEIKYSHSYGIVIRFYVFRCILTPVKHTCMTPPPVPSEVDRKWCGSPSILTSQSIMTTSSSVHAGDACFMSNTFSYVRLGKATFGLNKIDYDGSCNHALLPISFKWYNIIQVNLAIGTTLIGTICYF